jgi:hypothetical protein
MRALRAALTGDHLTAPAPADVQGVFQALAETSMGLVMAAMAAYFGCPQEEAVAEALRYIESHLAALVLGEVRPGSVPVVTREIRPVGDGDGEGGPE